MKVTSLLQWPQIHATVPTMNTPDLDVIAALQRWHVDGHRGVLVTLARTWGSAPRPPGALLAVRDDGLVCGSVSGGCIEDDLIERMRGGLLAGSVPFALIYGATAEEAARFRLPCGGTLEVVVEPAPDLAALEALAARVAAGRRVRRCIDLRDAAVVLGECGEHDALHWDGQQLITLHGPRRRLLIIGAGQIAQYLTPLAQALDYEVTVCDPREEYAREWSMNGCHLTTGMPDDVAIEMKLDSNSAVLALTHDPKLDDMVLLEALKTPAFYVGAVGSRANQARRRQRLLDHFDLSAEQIDRLRGPVGLPIDSRTPPEIAVAILAELVAVSRGVILQRSSEARSSIGAACAP